MEKCRNSEIKKKKSLRCKTDEEVLDVYEIEECIVWGIDLHTRNIIYHCLPEWDLDEIDGIENRDERNNFIEKTFMKAINSLGNDGYSIEKACNMIMNEKELFHSISTEENFLPNTQKKYVWKSSVFYSKEYSKF